MRASFLYKTSSFISALVSLFVFFLVNGLLGQSNIALALSTNPVPARYEMKVSFDPATSSLTGTAIIRLKTAQAVTLDVESLRITSLLLDDSPWQGKLPGHKQLTLPKARSIKIAWSARFNDSYDHGIFPGTIVLTDDWFPVIKGMMVTYRLQASLPKGYRAVSEGDTVTLRHSGRRDVITFDFQHPLPGEEGIGFVATNRYHIREEQVDGVLLRTLLTSDMEEYATPLMAQAKILLARYQVLFGMYPFKRLTIAEAPTSSSMSYPGYVLINRTNIKGLPEDRTLAHEIVHEWFGNGVFISWKTGNWAEGAAIYYADHGILEDTDNGWKCRRRILLGYLDWVVGKDEFPLTLFQSREDALSRWVGYGKGALFYHAARRELGDGQFTAAIRDFLARHRGQVATFDDLRQSFERASGKNLGWFFNQWVTGTGLPELSSSASVRPLKDGRYAVTLQLEQKGGQVPFRLSLPLRIITPSGEQTVLVMMDGRTASTVLETADRPSRIVVDPDFDLPRILSIDERIPTISQLEEEHDLQVMGRPDQMERFIPLLDNFKQRGVLIKTINPGRDFPGYRTGGERRLRSAQGSHRSKGLNVGIPDSELADYSLAVMGRDHPVVRRLFGQMTPVLPELPTKGFCVAVFKNPLNPRRIVAIFDSSDRGETRTGIDHLENYGGYSSVVFSGDTLVDKKIADGARGIAVPILFETNEP